MSTTLTHVDFGTDQWVSVPASWETYERLSADREEKSRPRLIYLDGRLTIVSPGIPHEAYKTRLGGLIELIFEGLSIDANPTGSVTILKTRGSREGVEADESYYLTNLDCLRDKRLLIIGESPPPDLVIEVVVSHPEDESLEVYRRFGVREVWVLKESGLTFLALDDARYTEWPTSRLLPFLSADELTPWVFRKDVRSDTQLRQEFRAWVETVLAPRVRADRRD